MRGCHPDLSFHQRGPMAFVSFRKRQPEPAAPAVSTPAAPADCAAAMPSDSERLVDQLANRIGGLGVELADVAGNLQEVAGRVSSQADRFGHLQKTPETMVSANH